MVKKAQNNASTGNQEVKPVVWDGFHTVVPLLDRPVVLSKETEAVLLGGAILGACASKEYESLQVLLNNFRYYHLMLECLSLVFKD